MAIQNDVAVATLPSAADAAQATVFREAMRGLAASVSIVTSRDSEGQPHGMVASSLISVSMDPPSMLVAINKGASIYPVIQASRRFCLNLLSVEQQAHLGPFSQSALKPQRFQSEGWRDVQATAAQDLPWLDGADAVIDCLVDATLTYGTHTIFVGRVLHTRCPRGEAAAPSPLVWFNGRCVTLPEAP